MSDVVVVLVEWRGPDQPCIIWRGKRPHEQWVAQEFTDQMGACRYAPFYAERIGDCWSLMTRCNGAKQQIADVLRRKSRGGMSNRPLSAPDRSKQID